MKFREWLLTEDENVIAQFEQIMSQTWGCSGQWFRKMFLQYNCPQPQGRTLSVKLFPSHPISADNPMAEVNFYQEVSHQSPKDAGLEYQANQTLQPGSLEFLRKLKRFATALRPLGVWIQYATNNRRDSIYDKALTAAGYTKSDIGVYRP